MREYVLQKKKLIFLGCYEIRDYVGKTDKFDILNCLNLHEKISLLDCYRQEVISSSKHRIIYRPEIIEKLGL